MIGEAKAGRSEDFIKYPAHREDSRAGIEANAVHLHLAQFPTRLCRAFQQRDLQTLRSELQRSDQPADTCPDHDYASCGHIAALSRHDLVDEAVHNV